MTRKQTGTIKVETTLIQRLKETKHLGQSLGGLIEELLNEHKQGTTILLPSTLERIEEYRQTPKETVDQLINIVLDELDKAIKDKTS
jgi:hypothetical protein